MSEVMKDIICSIYGVISLVITYMIVGIKDSVDSYVFEMVCVVVGLFLNIF